MNMESSCTICSGLKVDDGYTYKGFRRIAKVCQDIPRAKPGQPTMIGALLEQATLGEVQC